MVSHWVCTESHIFCMISLIAVPIALTIAHNIQALKKIEALRPSKSTSLGEGVFPFRFEALVKPLNVRDLTRFTEW